LNGEKEVHELAQREQIPVPISCFSSHSCSKCERYGGQKCMYIKVIQAYFKKLSCNDCGRHAIMFNPFNNNISCHNCGTIWYDKEKVILT
jgi:ribosomal protein S27E